MTAASEAVVVIVVDEGNDAQVFPDLRSAFGYLEAIDVEDGVHGLTAWTGEGDVVRISTEPAGGRDAEVVMTRTDQPSPRSRRSSPSSSLRNERWRRPSDTDGSAAGWREE